MTFLDDLAAASVALGLPVPDQQQLAAVMAEYELVDGTVYDLARTWRDQRDCLWWWTGVRDEQGRAVMVSSLGEEAPLVDVYLALAPLLPEPARLTAGAYRAAYLGGAA
ncbi:phiSA1p31-related protein [Streptomyces klenkii]|uniref:phiSA1p31-related protein n=1 Tax=Streptomyces klenkii TaxID=1420899 RepID=UPI0036E8BC04